MAKTKQKTSKKNKAGSFGIDRPWSKKEEIAAPAAQGGKVALDDIVSSFKDALKVQGLKLKDLSYEDVRAHLYSFLAGMMVDAPMGVTAPSMEQEPVTDGDDGE